jgi:outer membrane protein assembly factor BamB
MGFLNKLVGGPVTVDDKSRYIAHSDGVVIDKRTALVWPEKDAGIWLSFPDAVTYCQDLQLGEYHNWRLPTLDEIKDLRKSNVFCQCTSDDIARINSQHAGRPFWINFEKLGNYGRLKYKYKHMRIFLSSGPIWVWNRDTHQSMVYQYDISSGKERSVCSHNVLHDLYPESNGAVLPVHDFKWD